MNPPLSARRLPAPAGPARSRFAAALARLVQPLHGGRRPAPVTSGARGRGARSPPSRSRRGAGAGGPLRPAPWRAGRCSTANWRSRRPRRRGGGCRRRASRSAAGRARRWAAWRGWSRLARRSASRGERRSRAPGCRSRRYSRPGLRRHGADSAAADDVPGRDGGRGLAGCSPARPRAARSPASVPVATWARAGEPHVVSAAPTGAGCGRAATVGWRARVVLLPGCRRSRRARATGCSSPAAAGVASAASGVGLRQRAVLHGRVRHRVAVAAHRGVDDPRVPARQAESVEQGAAARQVLGPPFVAAARSRGTPAGSTSRRRR